MKNTWLILAGLAAAAALTTAQAAQISGEIDMSGTVLLNNIDLGSSSATTGYNSVEVGGTPSGTFAGIPTGASSPTVSWATFNYGAFTGPLALWNFTYGGNTYSFTLNSLTVQSKTSTFLNLTGSGVFSATGYTDTPGSWSFTVSNPGGGTHANESFTFANSQVSNLTLPDGGTTAMMLGLALSGLGLVSRKLKRA